MSVAHRWGRITKYASLACLTLAILSTLVLNIIFSYSNSSTRSKAEPVSNSSISTLADTELDPTGISISISSSTDSNNPNLSLQIPREGGIAVGRHTVTVSTGSSVIGYELQLSSDSEETNIEINNINGASEAIIAPTSGSQSTAPSQITNNTYGFTLRDIGSESALAYANVWYGLSPLGEPDVLAEVDGLTVGQANITANNIYWAARVNNTSGLLAGDYGRGIVYTVVGETVLAPEVTDLVLNSSWTDNTLDTAYGSTSILTGKNLNSVTGIYIDLNGNTVKDDGEEVTNLTHATGAESNTKLTFTAPTYTEESQKNVYLEWPGGEPVKIKNGWNYIEPSVCRSNINYVSGSIGTNGGDCYIDIDSNMIPVYYTGDENNPEWTIVRWSSVSGEWYDYSEGRWANAVTLRDDLDNGGYCVNTDPLDSEGYYRTNSASCSYAYNGPYTPLSFAHQVMSNTVYENNEHVDAAVHPDDILGYWVYIPRYSYEVMRRDAIDLVQQPEDFKIKFETADTTKKVPVEGCSDTNNPMSYRVGCSLNRTYTNTATNTEANTVTNTTWATHPAFTWMDDNGNPVELNGIWVGKFETTEQSGDVIATVLPSEEVKVDNIGPAYDIAQSIGTIDHDNLYGNVESPVYNNGKGYHNLDTTTSHMLKNSEWGSVAYLSASRYGAGVNAVKLSNIYTSSGTGRGPNGGEYNTVDGRLASTTNTVYGVYDMAGGSWEYVMGGYTDNVLQSMTNKYLYIAVKPPYIDLYANPPFEGTYNTNGNYCTWETCGGHALHETQVIQSALNNVYAQSWSYDTHSSFVAFSSKLWFERGGSAYDDYKNRAGVFSYGSDDGYGYFDGQGGFRVVLITN